VANALETVETEVVAIHDAARPLVTASLIRDVLSALAADAEAAGAIAAAPIADTVKRVAGDPTPKRLLGPDKGSKRRFAIEETLDRTRLWAAQTPQAFRTDALRRAIGSGAEPATDEATLVEAAGGAVLIHPSSEENLKVTKPVDLALAEQLLARRGPSAGV
jgi:2-C-methyl-D-erythritol 4-phosphate cytidylyltransferase